jgi:RNA polymerase sigma-70 factor, ECF subfamily
MGHHHRFESRSKVGDKRQFAFAPKPHWDLGTELGLIDFERGVKISGSRFYLLRGDANARPWFYRILRTVLSDIREKSGRRQQLVYITRLEDAHDELIGGEHDALFSEVVARLDGEAVHRGLKSIPEDFAAAVELHDIDGFKYVEIAEIVGVPIGTVMSRIARGRKLLAGAIMAERGAAAAEGRSADLTERRAARGGPR